MNGAINAGIVCLAEVKGGAECAIEWVSNCAALRALGIVDEAETEAKGAECIGLSEGAAEAGIGSIVEVEVEP
jgi:hypothetical protein